MGKTIGVTLALKDKFTPQMSKIAKEIGITEKELKKATADIKKFQAQLANGFKKASTFVAASTVAIGAAMATVGYSCVQAASDLEETNNKIDVVFGKGSESVKKWAETSIQKMGLASQTALDTAALYGDMATGMGMPTDKAQDMAMSLTQLSADLASFKNVSNDVAKNALNGVFTGESEGLKKLGVVMDETTLSEYAHSKGINKKLKDMKQAEKIQLRYNYVMSKTKNAQGDYEKTGGGFANQQRGFLELQKEIQATIGLIFSPAVTAGITKLNKFLVAHMSDIKKVVEVTYKAISKVVKFLAHHIKIVLPLASMLFSTLMAYKAITSVISVFKSLRDVIAAINTVQGIWNALLLANPIGIAAVIVGGLVAAGVALYMNWDKVVNVMKRAWEWIKKVAEAAKKISPAVLAMRAAMAVTGQSPAETRQTKSAVIANKTKGHALGTKYFSGGYTEVNEGKRGEMIHLPSGSTIVPHNETKKALGNSYNFDIHFNVNGSLIGTAELYQQFCNMLTIEIQKKLAAV